MTPKSLFIEVSIEYHKQIMEERGILSKTIVTKTVTKKIAGILGDEAAAVLINGSSDPGKLIKYISKLESAGISDRVISQMALNLETESFEKLGKLATKGMSSDFLLQLAANEAVLNQVLDETAFLVFKGTTHSAEDIVRLVGENGGDFIRLYTAHGDDVAEAILKCGSEAITDIDTYKDGFLDLVRFYGDEFSELYRKYGHDATEKGILYGEEFFMLVEEYGEDCAEVIIRYGDEAMDAVRRLGDDFLVQYRNYGEQFVEDFIQYGDDAVEAYVEYGDKAGEVLAGSNITVTIVKETDLYIEYMNKSGTIVRISKQSSKSISAAISSKLNSDKLGDRVEAKVADFIKNDMGLELTDFSNKVKDTTGQVIGDIDCATKDVWIEVKSSIGSVDVLQFVKYIDSNNTKYINVLAKKVVLYIDEPMEEIASINAQKISELRAMGVEIVNSLEELKGVLE